MSTTTRSKGGAPSWGKRIGVAAGLGLGAMSLATGLATSASAAPTLPNINEPNYSLTIHKYTGDNPSSQTPNGGVQTPGPGYAPAADVEFSWQRVDGINLFTNGGWDCANTLSAAYASSGAFPTGLTCDNGDGLGTVPIVLSATAQGDFDPTDATGTTSINQATPNFTKGLYLVTEEVGVPGYTPAAPFLVAVPMTTPDGEDWNYAVHVYPKNLAPSTEKDVVDGGDFVVGAVLDYTITAQLGGVPQGTTPEQYSITEYHILDMLPAGLEVTDPVTGLAVTLRDQDNNVLDTLVAGDYTVEVFADQAAAIAAYPNLNPAPAQDGQWVVITFTAQGLAKMVAAQNSDYPARVQVAYQATVTTAGEKTNIAPVFPDTDSWDDGDSPETPPAVVTKFGQRDFQKNGKDGTTVSPLPGAVFSVYAVQGEAGLIAGTATITCANLDVSTATALLTGLTSAAEPVAPATTPAAGSFTAGGLRFSNWANGAALNLTVPADRALHVTYCLVETDAPTGWARLAQPFAFEVDTAEPNTDIAVINDVKSNGGFDLPMTGAAGLATLITVGSILGGAGVLLVVASRRRNMRAEAL